MGSQIAMNQDNGPETEQHHSIPLPSQYYSVEFTLNAPHPVYQFKLWRSDHNALFLLVKDNSKVLPQLKMGAVLPMKYHDGSGSLPFEVRETLIEKIINEKQGRFKGHHRVELNIISPDCGSGLN